MTYKDIKGYCDYHEFYKEVFDKLPDGAVVAEVGVYLGHSVAYLATLARESGKDITIYAVDTFEGSKEHKLKGVTAFYDEFIKNMEGCGVQGIVVPIKGTSEEVSGLIDEKSLDFVFLDAAHDYENVKNDIKMWRNKVKEGGILAGHDYVKVWAGVMKAVDEVFPKKKLKNSVWSALKD